MRTRPLPVHAIAFLALLSLLARRSTLPAADKWIQIGNGIHVTDAQEADGTHHQSGRVIQVAWAWDNQQGIPALWAGASDGGLWKTLIDKSSGKVTGWATITDNFPGSHHLGSFAVKKGDSNSIVIGTGSRGWGDGDGIYYTLSEGQDVLDGQAWYSSRLCSDTGVCGPATTARVNRIVADALDSTGATLVAATSDGIWHSFDFGQTWFSRLAGVEASDVVQDTGDTSRWYAGIVGQGIYLSTAYATSWAPYGSGIGGSPTRISLAASVATKALPRERLYALVVKDTKKSGGVLQGLYRSKDQGLTWERIYSDDATLNPDDQGNHACAIACDPEDPNHLFVGLAQAVEITNAATAAEADVEKKAIPIDGGHADYNFFLFADDSKHLHIANDGGYYYYDDSGGCSRCSKCHACVNDNGNILGLDVLELSLNGNYGQGGLESSWSNPDVFVAGLQDNGLVHGNVSKDPAALTFIFGGDDRYVSISPDHAGVYAFGSNSGTIRQLHESDGSFQGLDFQLSAEKSAPLLIDPLSGLGTPRIFTADQDLKKGASGIYYTDASSPGPSWSLVKESALPGFVSNLDLTLDTKACELVATVAGSASVISFRGTRDHPGRLSPQDVTPPLPSTPSAGDARINASRSTATPTALYYTSGNATPQSAFVRPDEKSDWIDVTGDIVSKSGGAHLVKLVGNPGDDTDYFLATNKGVFRGARDIKTGAVTWHDYSEGLRIGESVQNIVVNFDNVSGKPTLYIATRGRGFWRRTIE